MILLAKTALLSAGLLLLTACGSDGGQSDPALENSVAPRANVELSVTVESDAPSGTLTVGDTFNMTVTVLNQAESAANNVTISVPLPKMVRYIGSSEQCRIDTLSTSTGDVGAKTPTPEQDTQSPSTALSCTLNELASNAEQTLRLAMQMLQSGDVSLTVSASADQNDDDLANNFAKLDKLIEQCDECPTDRELGLSWASSGDNSLTGYYVYFGKTPENLTRQIATIPIGAEPSLRLRSWWDLNVQLDEQACFAIQAFTATQESELSEPFCTIITLPSTSAAQQ